MVNYKLKNDLEYGTKLRPFNDDTEDDLTSIEDENMNEDKPGKNKKNSVVDSVRKRSSPMPAKQTRTSKLREEMNAKKSMKSCVNEAAVATLIDVDLKAELNEEIINKELKLQMDQIIKDGVVVDNENNRYILIPEDKAAFQQAEVERLQKELLQSKDDLMKQQTTVKDLQDRIKHSNEINKDLQDRIKHSNEINEDLQDRIKRSNERNEDLQDRIKHSNEINEDLNKSLINAKEMAHQQIEKSNEETAILQKKIREAENELNKERQEIEVFCQMYKEKLKQYENEQKTIEKENQEMLHDLKLKVSCHEQKFDNLALNDLVQLITNLEIMNADLQESMLIATNEKTTLEKQCVKEKEENQKFAQNEKTLKEKIVELERDSEKVGKENSELKSLYEETSNDLKNCKEKLVQSELQMTGKEKKLIENIEDIDNKNILIDQLNDEINSLQNEISKSCENLVLMKKENDSLKEIHSKEKENLKQEMKDKIDCMSKEYLSKKDEFHSQIENLQKENSSLKTEIFMKSNLLSDMDDKIVSLNKQIEVTSKENQSEISKREALEKKLQEDVRNAETSHEEKKEKLKNEIEQIRIESAKNSQFLRIEKEKVMENQRHELGKQLTELQKALKKKDKEIETLTELHKQYKESLADKKSNEVNEYRKTIADLTQQIYNLKLENEKNVSMYKELQCCLEKTNSQYCNEKENLLLSIETKTQKIQQMSKNQEDQKQYFELLISEKSKELCDMQSDIEAIEELLEKKEDELNSLKEQVKLIQTDTQEKTKSQEKTFNEILKNERNQLEETYRNKLELQEARLEKKNNDIIEELRREFSKRNDELITQRDDLVEALKSRSKSVSSELITARIIDNLQLEINKKDLEIDKLKTEMDSKEKLILYISDMLEKERKEITGSNKEILMKLNDITSSIHQNTSQKDFDSGANSIDSFLNNSSISNSDNLPYFQDLNTTWPTGASTKRFDNLYRSYDSLLSGQSLLKEQISGLKYDINTKINDLQRDQLKMKPLKNSKNTTNNIGKGKFSREMIQKKQMKALEKNLEDLQGLYSSLEQEDIVSECSDSFKTWKTKTEDSIKSIQVKFDDYSTYTAPFSITSSIVYHPTNTEVQTIIDDVNKKYTAIHSDVESM